MPSQASAPRPVKTGTPGIYKRGNRYIDTWKERGKPKSRYYKTLTAAKRGRAERIAAGNQTWSRERFDHYATRWVEGYHGRTKRGLAASTRTEYRKIVDGWLIPHFRHTPLADIGPGVVRDFVDDLVGRTNRSGQPLAAATVRWVMVPLKAMLADAYEKELVPLDASRVRVVVPDRVRGRQRPRAMTSEQTVQVLAAVPARYRLLFMLLAYTGLRISEALGLQWQDLEQTPTGPVLSVRRQFYRGRLTEETKTYAGTRQVALIPPLARELVRHRADASHPNDTDPVFATKFGTHISAHNIRRVLRPITDRLDLAWVTPHVFRHSLATQLRDAGHDANAIANVLGHTDPGFTQRRYIHTADVVRFDDLLDRREHNLEHNLDAENGGNS